MRQLPSAGALRVTASLLSVADNERLDSDPSKRMETSDPGADFSAGKVVGLYKQGLAYQRRQLEDYWLNHAFLEGNQWLFVDPSNRTLVEVPRDPDRYQGTFNRLAHSVRSIMSKYTQRELAFEVLPDEATDKAMTGAKVSQSVLEGLRRAHDWEVLREVLGRAAFKGGSAAVCVDWDPNAGEPLFDGGALDTPENPYTKADEIGEMNEGDTVESVLSIPEYVLQPGVKDGERGKYWIKAQVLPPDVVRDTYSLPKLPPADALAGLTPFASKLMLSHLSMNDNDERPELTLVLTYYERPNPKNREGRVAVVVDGVFVDGPKPWPFPWTDRLNIAIHRETVDEHKAFGSTVLSQARQPQVALNGAWSNFLEHLKQAGNARLLVDATNVDIIESLTDQPGEIVPWQTGTQKPEWLAPAPLADWAWRMVEELRQEIDDILGVHDVSRGQAPVNIESGYGLSILAEQDTSPVGRMVKDSAIVWAKVATMVLKLYQQETSHTRKTTIKRDTLGPKTVEWSGDTLAGQTDVTIPLDGILPRSRAAQMAVAEKFVQMGLITNIELAAKMAELPGQDELVAAVNPDVYKARRENYFMGRGRPSTVEPFDNHGAHIQEHTNEMKTMDWEDAPMEIRDLFLQHVQAHQTMAMEAAGKAQARAQLSPIAATAPNAESIPTIDPSAIPPGAVTEAAPAAPGGEALPADQQAPPEMAGAQPLGGPEAALDQLPPEALAMLEGGGGG